MAKSKEDEKKPDARFQALTDLVSNKAAKEAKDKNQPEQFVDPVEQAHEADASDAPDNSKRAKDYGAEDQFVTNPMPSPNDESDQFMAEKSSPQDEFQQSLSSPEEAEAIVLKRKALKKFQGLKLYEDV
jgi:hypothetical protein